MPISADKLKQVGMKWIQGDIRIEPNAGLKEHVSTFRELGLTDREIALLIRASLRKRLQSIVENALGPGSDSK